MEKEKIELVQKRLIERLSSTIGKSLDSYKSHVKNHPTVSKTRIPTVEEKISTIKEEMAVASLLIVDTSIESTPVFTEEALVLYREYLGVFGKAKSIEELAVEYGMKESVIKSKLVKIDNNFLRMINIYKEHKVEELATSTSDKVKMFGGFYQFKNSDRKKPLTFDKESDFSEISYKIKKETRVYNFDRKIRVKTVGDALDLYEKYNNGERVLSESNYIVLTSVLKYLELVDETLSNQRNEIITKRLMDINTEQGCYLSIIEELQAKYDSLEKEKQALVKKLMK